MALGRHDRMLTDVGDVDLVRPARRPTIAEFRVLQLVALGLSSREIASRLWVSRQAVTYHIGSLFMKLHADSRAGLVARAYALGVFSPGIWPPASTRRMRIHPSSRRWGREETEVISRPFGRPDPAGQRRSSCMPPADPLRLDRGRRRSLSM